MGGFRIEIEAVGGHGCERKAKEGEQVYGCNRMDCPDCLTREFVARLGQRFGDVKATFTHWPGQASQVVDRIEPFDGGHARVTRERGDFG